MALEFCWDVENITSLEFVWMGVVVCGYLQGRQTSNMAAMASRDQVDKSVIQVDGKIWGHVNKSMKQKNRKK